MKNGSYAGRRSIRTGPVGAGTARPVREAAVVPPIRCAAPFPSLCRPDVSLRGAKRRGNLAVPGRTTGKPSAKSQLPPRDCTPRALPRASRSGRHVASLLAMTHQGGAAVGTVHSAELALLLPLRGLAGRALLLQWRTVIAVSASSGRTGRCRTTRRRSGQRERGSWRPC